jgi:hypothetical protein
MCGKSGTAKPKRNYPESVIQKSFVRWLEKFLETTWYVVVPPGWKRKRGRRKFKGKGALIKRLGKNNKDMGYWAGT